MDQISQTYKNNKPWIMESLKNGHPILSDFEMNFKLFILMENSLPVCGSSIETTPKLDSRRVILQKYHAVGLWVLLD